MPESLYRLYTFDHPASNPYATRQGGFLDPQLDPAASAQVLGLRKTAPKVYYSTRTHSQIAQVVSELRRSQYRPRMAILASRMLLENGAIAHASSGCSYTPLTLPPSTPRRPPGNTTA